MFWSCRGCIVCLGVCSFVLESRFCAGIALYVEIVMVGLIPVNSRPSSLFKDSTSFVRRGARRPDLPREFTYDTAPRRLYPRPNPGAKRPSEFPARRAQPGFPHYLQVNADSNSDILIQLQRSILHIEVRYITLSEM